MAEEQAADGGRERLERLLGALAAHRPVAEVGAKGVDGGASAGRLQAGLDRLAESVKAVQPPRQFQQPEATVAAAPPRQERPELPPLPAPTPRQLPQPLPQLASAERPRRVEIPAAPVPPPRYLPQATPELPPGPAPRLPQPQVEVNPPARLGGSHDAQGKLQEALENLTKELRQLRDGLAGRQEQHGGPQSDGSFVPTLRSRDRVTRETESPSPQSPARDFYRRANMDRDRSNVRSGRGGA